MGRTRREDLKTHKSYGKNTEGRLKDINHMGRTWKQQQLLGEFSVSWLRASVPGGCVKTRMYQLLALLKLIDLLSHCQTLQCVSEYTQRINHYTQYTQIINHDTQNTLRINHYTLYVLIINHCT